MCALESGLWVVCAIVILAICDVDSLGVVHLDYFFVSFLCSLEGGASIFISEFEILGDKFLLCRYYR